MPHINIDYIAPKDQGHTDALLEIVVRGCAEAIGAHPSAIIAQLTSRDGDAMSLPAGHSDGFTLITVALYEGRSADVKSAFTSQVRAALNASLGLDEHDVWVRFDDKSRADLHAVHPA